MTKDEMKCRISMALKEPILQQGFEIICKDLAVSEHDREHNDYELTEVYKQVEKLEKEKCELLGIIQGKDKAIFDLKKENAELKKQQFTLRNEQYEKDLIDFNEELTKAIEIIKKYLSIGVGGKITQNYLDVTKEAEQFLSEAKK